jgi:prepilin-type N-terminal cleavage/methylation domain-containing protein
MARNQDGFSLLEVLVSLAVVALTAAVVLRVYGLAGTASARGERALEALMIAESTLAEYGVSRPLKVGTTWGDATPGYRWQAEVAAYAAFGRNERNQLPVTPYQVAVTVHWGDDPGERITLTALKIESSGDGG